MIHKVLSSPTGSPVTQDSHDFLTDYKWLGRETEAQQQDGNGNILSKVTTEFVLDTSLAGTLPANTWFVAPKKITSYPIWNGSTVFNKQDEYVYDNLASTRQSQRWTKS